MARQVTQYVVDKIKQWEGLKLKDYKDSVGVLTIGYGHTGSDVKQGMQITKQQAEALLAADLIRFDRWFNAGGRRLQAKKEVDSATTIEQLNNIKPVWP